MSIKYTVTTITAATTTYPATPQLDAGFAGQVSLALMTLPAGGHLFYSLDGITDHGELLVGTPAITWASSTTYGKVWLRNSGVADVSIQIQVETYDR